MLIRSRIDGAHDAEDGRRNNTDERQLVFLNSRFPASPKVD
jgi:hypothetical protein